MFVIKVCTYLWIVQTLDVNILIHRRSFYKITAFQFCNCDEYQIVDIVTIIKNGQRNISCLFPWEFANGRQLRAKRFKADHTVDLQFKIYFVICIKGIVQVPTCVQCSIRVILLNIDWPFSRACLRVYSLYIHKNWAFEHLSLGWYKALMIIYYYKNSIQNK